MMTNILTERAFDELCDYYDMLVEEHNGETDDWLNESLDVFFGTLSCVGCEEEFRAKQEAYWKQRASEAMDEDGGNA